MALRQCKNRPHGLHVMLHHWWLHSKPLRVRRQQFSPWLVYAAWRMHEEVLACDIERWNVCNITTHSFQSNDSELRHKATVERSEATNHQSKAMYRKETHTQLLLRVDYFCALCTFSTVVITNTLYTESVTPLTAKHVNFPLGVWKLMWASFHDATLQIDV